FVAVNAFGDDRSADELAAAFQTVSEGTLFVNGVAGLDLAGQGRLMEVLVRAPFRLVASCGTRIDEKAEAGDFRSDLLYALVANEIVVPPLSQRGEDAVWLATHTFQALNQTREVPMRGVSDLALSAIRDHGWPGNGRELRSRLLRAMDVATTDWIFPADIFPELNQRDAEVQSLSEARDV